MKTPKHRKPRKFIEHWASHGEGTGTAWLVLILAFTPWR
jgi:hypothetical protein